MPKIVDLIYYIRIFMPISFLRFQTYRIYFFQNCDAGHIEFRIYNLDDLKLIAI